MSGRKIKSSSVLANVLVEIFSIVFAVLLALAVNQWRENRSHQKLGDKALENIRVEMTENLKLFERILPLHQALYDSTKAMIEAIESGVNAQDSDLSHLTFQPIFLSETAWKAAIATQALIYIEYDIVSLLSKVYLFQQTYQKLTDDFLQATFSIEYHEKEKTRAQLDAAFGAIQAFLVLEKEMPKLYREALEKSSNYRK